VAVPPDHAKVVFANQTGEAVRFTVESNATDPVTQDLAPGGESTTPFLVTPDAYLHNSLSVMSLAHEGCGNSDAMNFFQKGKAYRVTAVPNPQAPCFLPEGQFASVTFMIIEIASLPSSG
jgi:hypothetical protein